MPLPFAPERSDLNSSGILGSYVGDNFIVHSATSQPKALQFPLLTHLFHPETHEVDL